MFRRIAFGLVLACGVLLLTAGVFSFFKTPSRHTHSPSGHTSYKLILGRFASSKHEFKHPTRNYSTATYWELESCDFPIQLKIQKLSESLWPVTGERKGLCYGYQYAPESNMVGGGFIVQLIPTGLLLIAVALMWLYWQRRQKKTESRQGRSFGLPATDRR